MFSAILSWLTGGGIAAIGKQLTRAYELKLQAQNDSERIAADIQIKILETRRDAMIAQAGIIKEGMQHKVFWIPWLIAAIPVSLWFGWGMLDSLCNGALPDVAALPPQLKGYADIVFQNLFYTGAGMASAQVLSSALKGRK